MSAFGRWVLHVARSPRCREDAARVATVLLLLAPVLLLATDHHGAERLPSHSHAVPFGQPTAAHLHGFEVPHVDATGQPDTALATPAVLAPEPMAVLVLVFAQALGLPLARPPVVVVSARGPAAAPIDPLADQAILDLPTRPPTAVS